MKIRNEYKQPNGAQTKINKNKKGQRKRKGSSSNDSSKEQQYMW